MSVEDFLRAKGLNPNQLVIYDMNNINNPRIPLVEWLREFEEILKENK